MKNANASDTKNITSKASATAKNGKDDDSKYPIKRGVYGNVGNWFGMFFTRLLIRLRAVGLENIPKRIPYVIAANHETYVDGMWIGAFLPRQHFKHMACIAGSDLESSHGWLGRLIVRVGRAVPIDRFGNPIRGLIIAKRKIDEGNIMLVHPEGTRSMDGHLGEMKNGAAYMALKSHVPILPVFIDGGYEVFSRHMKWPKPLDEKGRRRTVILNFGRPLNPDDYKDAQDMTDALMAWMIEQFNNKKIPRTFAAEPTSAP